MSGATIIVWGILVTILAGASYWHIRENHKIIADSKKRMPEAQATWLAGFAWSRSMQLLIALAACFLLVAYYSLKLENAQATIETLSAAPPPVQSTERKPLPQAEAPTEPVVLEAVNEPVVAPAAEIPAPDIVQATSDQLYAEPVKPLEEPKPPELKPATENLDDVFKPSESSTDGQSAIDTLKQRYEEMLVTYFFLDKCGLAEKNDYYIIMAALSQDMASVDAPGRMQYDILTAARGSYDEVYAQSPCDGADTQTLLTQYKDYIQVLAQYGQKQP